METIPLGSRIRLNCDKIDYSGVLDEVAEDGVVVSWFVMEWQTVNGKQQEIMLRSAVFVPYDRVVDYTVTR
jgi:hypothetical protein